MNDAATQAIPIAIMSFPTRMIVGPKALGHLAGEVRRLGAVRALIVADQGVVRAGIVDRVETLLDQSGVAHGRYLEIAKNPKEADVLNGVEAYRALNAQVVIGVGGGASLDVAKAIRLKVTHPLPLIEYDDARNGFEKITADQPPMIAIPTTSGTGSEVGRSSIIALGHDLHKVVVFSPFMIPNVAICDAELTVGLPPEVTASTGMDALTHCLESYVSKGNNPFCDMFALAGLARCGEYLRAAVQDGKNMKARHEMMLAASMGAISFQKGLGACHALAHPLSAVADLHHGLANSIMLPHVVAYNLEYAIPGYAIAARALGFASGGDTAAQARACLDGLRKLVRDIGLPTRLSQVGVTAEHIEPMIAQAMEDAAGPGNPRPLTADVARRLYETAM